MNPRDYFPPPPDRTQHPTAYVFGCQILAYILAAKNPPHSCDVYGLLTDEDLELANHAAHTAVSARDILPCAVDTISAIRHQIARVLTARQAERAAALELAQVPTPAPGAPNEGPMARLITPPHTQPPAPAYATPDPSPAPVRTPVVINF